MIFIKNFSFIDRAIHCRVQSVTTAGDIFKGNLFNLCSTSLIGRCEGSTALCGGFDKSVDVCRAAFCGEELAKTQT